MKKSSLLLMTAALFAFVSCNNNTANKANEESTVEDSEIITEIEVVETALQVVLDSKSGSEASGVFSFTEKDGVVYMEGKVTGLSPDATHAIHLHENGDCSDDEGMAAGGHWNPTDSQHGQWDHEDGYHQGDIGNLQSNAEGEATLAFETDQWCIGCDDAEKNIIGKSIIVHAGEDDFQTQPTGDAGGRIACGVIQ